MANYKYENNNYYRLSTDGKWFKVNRNDDGYLTWKQPDGRVVYDDSFKVPAWMTTTSKGTYIVSTGANGSRGQYTTFEDAINAYNKSLYNFTDPSENVLNDLMTVGIGSLNSIPKATSTVYNTVKTLLLTPAKLLVKAAVKEAPKVAVSVAAGKGVDKVTKNLTGKTWGENVADVLTKRYGFEVPTIVGDFTNPGNYLGYNYGNFITNNYSNLGRYTLDNLYPAGYSLKQIPSAFKGHILALYKKPPTFYNHRPNWYWKLPEGEFRDARFENGANWARISENEVPRRFFVRRKDGVYEPTYLRKSGMTLMPEFKHKGETKVDSDFITPGMVGGEHSDFIYLGSDPLGNQAILFRDRQKLNPQWILSKWLKETFKLKEKTPFYNFVDKLGGYDLGWVLGYKPFTIEAGIGFPKGHPEKGQQIDLDILKNVKLH